MTHCPWTPTAYLFPLMLLSFLISQIRIADCLSIPTVKMMHNCCILWMETLWPLKCLHSPICSSAVIYFPADNIRSTGTHNAEASTTFITLISRHSTHTATDQQQQPGLEDLQSSPSPLRLSYTFLRFGSSGKEPRHGYLPMGGVPKIRGQRDPWSEQPSSLVDTTVHWFPPRPTGNPIIVVVRTVAIFSQLLGLHRWGASMSEDVGLGLCGDVFSASGWVSNSMGISGS